MSRHEKFLNETGIVNVSKDKNIIEPDYRVPYKPLRKSIAVENYRRIFDKPEDSPSPKMHYQMIDAALFDDKNVSLLVHREGAKSVKITRDLILTLAVESLLDVELTNIMIISSTYTQAKDLLKNLKTFWERSKVLQSALVLAKDGQGKKIAYNESEVCFERVNGTRVYIHIRSALAEMRGTSRESVRPQLVILDDILKQATLVSKKERVKTIDWYQEVLVLAMSTKWRKVIAVGTPMTEDDLLALFGQSSKFLTLRFPIYQIHDNKKYSSWPKYHTIEKIEEERDGAIELGLGSRWDREKLLKIISGEARIFKEEDFKFFNMKTIEERIKYMNIYTSIDMAVSQEESGDLFSLMTIGVDSAGRVFILRVDCGKKSPKEIIDLVIEHAREFNSETLVGEKAALQLVLNWFLEDRLFKEDVFMEIVNLSNNSNKSKHLRIIGIEPTFESRRLFIPLDVSREGTEELLIEMRGYSREGKTTRYDDVIDSLANFFEEGIVEIPTKWKEE